MPSSGGALDGGLVWGRPEGVVVAGLESCPESEDTLRASPSPVSHAGLFAASGDQRLARSFHLTAADPQFQVPIARLVDAATVVFHVGDQLSQRIAFGDRPQVISPCTKFLQGFAATAIP